MAPKPHKTLMRNLGEFVGHIVHGVKADVGSSRHVTRHEVEEETREVGDQKVTLRRTTIEEIEVDPTNTSSNQEKAE